ncbi:hypothetical protein [Duganella vulcania]|uniref:Uncharacterized protein n=1 Tax=Duganella vulcania TaxID=2692166 RepID=A0A845GDS4_9BURK|nr:hypothetical protein [Duganella vulcania]MYM92773.1 hypothetical protein [Duganella vulcania]
MKKSILTILTLVWSLASPEASFAKQPPASDNVAQQPTEQAGAPTKKQTHPSNHNATIPTQTMDGQQFDRAKLNPNQAIGADGRCSCAAHAECVTNRGAHFCTNDKGKRRMLVEGNDKT